MTFPQTVLPLEVELLLDDIWTSITSLVRGKNQVTIKRGRPDEASTVDTSSCAFSANNTNGNLSPRNPTGDHYGLIGRNTRMRVRLPPGSPGYLLSSGASGDFTGTRAKASTPDSAALSITGDIDLRIEIEPTSWRRAGSLANKYNSTGDQRSWTWALKADGTVAFGWSSDGTNPNTFTKTSTAAVPDDSTSLALRVTLDVNNGAAGNTVTFYTSDSIDGTWTQLGSAVVTSGTTSIFDSTSELAVGAGNTRLITGGDATLTGQDMTGVFYAFEMRQGIAGTVKARVDFDTDGEADETTFTAADGLDWTLTGAVSLVRPELRFDGEISQWPQRWDTSGTDVYVPLEASGIKRRLSQGASPLQSTLRRGYVTQSPQPKAYWPCEDADGATQIASGLGGPAMNILSSATPTFASFDEFACSLPIPTLQSSHWLGQVPSYTGTGDVQVTFLLHIPSGEAATNGRIVTIYTTGTAAAWILDYQGGGGDLRLRAFDKAGTQLMSSGNIDFNVDGRLLRVSVQLEQDGSDIDWSVDAIEVGVVTAGGTGGTLAGRTISRCSFVRVGGGSTALGDDIAVGHIAVHDTILALSDLQDEFDAYVGETAGRRIERLCGDEGVAFRAVGILDESAAMGPQQPAELLTLMQDAADADGGILYEPRDLFGLAYRTRQSMYDQRARLTLDYDSADLSAIEPVDDDQQTRNDITVTRTGGSSVRAVEDTGPLSVSAPPDGVGRYDQALTLNLEKDGQLQDAAGWLLHLGTVDEARYPEITLDLARSNFTSDTDLALAVLDLDEGDRVVITDPPSWLPPDDITQLAQGFTEIMSNFTHTVAVNLTPESPWGAVARYDDGGVSRYSSDGTTLAEALDTTETGVDVSTPSGPVWTHADGDFDIVVGGERMTVTAISGTGASQTFTVTRSINGVVKSHSSGAEVALAHPVVYAR